MPQSQLRQQDLTTSFDALPAIESHQVSILNTSGQAIEIAVASDTDQKIDLPDGKSVMLRPEKLASFFAIKAAAATGTVQLVID